MILLKISYQEMYKLVKPKISIPILYHDKTIERLQEKLHVKYETDLLDGVKIKINDDSWALIRK